jgi:hypothetical protein
MSSNTEQSKQSDEAFATDLLRGGLRIAAYLKELGWGDGDPDVAYYAAKTKSWPISKIGKALVASRAALARHAKKATAA